MTRTECALIIAKKDREAEHTRTAAIWKARKTMWYGFDAWTSPLVLAGRRGESLAQQLKALRETR